MLPTRHLLQSAWAFTFFMAFGLLGSRLATSQGILTSSTVGLGVHFVDGVRANWIQVSYLEGYPCSWVFEIPCLVMKEKMIMSNVPYEHSPLALVVCKNDRRERETYTKTCIPIYTTSLLTNPFFLLHIFFSSRDGGRNRSNRVLFTRHFFDVLFAS